MTFEKPSDLFRWCLASINTGNSVYSYDSCFSQYKTRLKKDGYLWRMYDGRLKELISEVVGQPQKRVLEVGCGFGHDLVWAALHGHKCLGIDVNSDFVNISTHAKVQIENHIGKNLNITIARINILEMSENLKFDLIYMKDVFHHLEPREAIVKKLVELLAPGGKLIIVEPNALNILIQYQMYRVRGFKVLVEKTDPITGERYLFGNERLVTGRKISSLFRFAGLKGTVRHMRLLPTKFTNHALWISVAQWLEKFGLEIFSPICIHTIYVGRKSP